MKISLLIIAILLAGTAQAETDASWWQFWHSADEVTNTSGRLFTELKLLDDRVMRLMDDTRDILDVLQVY